MLTPEALNALYLSRAQVAEIVLLQVLTQQLSIPLGGMDLVQGAFVIVAAGAVADASLSSNNHSSSIHAVRRAGSSCSGSSAPAAYARAVTSVWASGVCAWRRVGGCSLHEPLVCTYAMHATSQSARLGHALLASLNTRLSYLLHA